MTLNPVADTYVNASSPGTNYGTSTSIRADGSPDEHSYLKFSVTGLPGGATIISAHLMIFANSSGTQGIRALAVADTTWGELTMNYTNAPALGSTLATSAAFAAATWVNMDVTAYITGNGTYSIGINTPSSTGINLAARESGANAEQLIITYK
jgi:hypothetical protein